ncbi:hypothetical protein FQA39_LY17213 [Lamprigera yunnana]|nr:hypothetical protein FQA39_LY17213 [Lamprigera yunnana]
MGKRGRGSKKRAVTTEKDDDFLDVEQEELTAIENIQEDDKAERGPLLKYLLQREKICLKGFKIYTNLKEIDIDKPESVDNFVILYMRLEKTVSGIDDLDININELKLEMNPEFTPTLL